MNFLEYIYRKNEWENMFHITPDNTCTDYEEHMAENVFYCLMSTLQDNPDKPVANIDVWTDGIVILCKTKTIADFISNALNAITGCNFTHCSYYDPEEDKKNGEVDDHTGWWYVDFD